MKDLFLKWAMQIILKAVAQYLTPEKIEEGKVLLIAFLRKEASTLSPTFPFDDELVNLIAAAIGVP